MAAVARWNTTRSGGRCAVGDLVDGVAVGGAVGGFEVVEPVGDGEESGAGVVEVGEAFFDFEPVGDQSADVFAGGSALL